MPRLTSEVTVDWDFDKHNPCWLAIRLLKAIHFLNTYNIPHLIFLTGQGIHIKIYTDPDMDPWAHIKLRTYLNDDFNRLALDIARISGRAKIWNILFTWRFKRYAKVKKSRETLLNTKDIEQVLNYLIEKCEEKVKNH